MSDAKFTPGPWRVGMESRNNASQVYSGKENSICMVYDIWSNRNVDECKDCKGMANAHLIAAAPDLYEALTDMLSGWKYIRETHGDLYGVGWDRAQQKAEAALAKARGESC